MKRRGFLGLIGGAAVAGPGMVKQAAASVGLESLVLPSAPYYGDPEPGYDTGLHTAGEEYDHAKWLRGRIAEIVGISDQERRERIAAQHVPMLDPDLAASRSFSLAFKIQEQKRRNFERYQARDHRNLTRELAEHLKQRLS